jgi:hypothetical protein
MGSVYPESTSGIYIVGEHVSETNGDRIYAAHAVHQRDLPLLLMTDGMRHDPKPWVAPIAKLRIRHRDRSRVMRSRNSASNDEASVD